MLMNIVILKNYSMLSKRFLSPFSFRINEDNNNRILILYKYCNIFNHLFYFLSCIEQSIFVFRNYWKYSANTFNKLLISFFT